jgi:dTDP-4-amino-4,6-dideoxygalactose transaminase
LGLSQFKKLDEFVAARNKIAEIYDDLLKDIDIVAPCKDEKNHSAYHLYVVRIRADQPGINHKEAFVRLRNNGVGVNLHYIPIYRQPYYARMGYKPSDYPEAERYYSEAITLPIYPGLTISQQKEIVKHFKKPYPLGFQTIF